MRHASGACVAVDAPSAVSFGDGAKSDGNGFVALDTLARITVGHWIEWIGCFGLKIRVNLPTADRLKRTVNRPL